MWFIKIHKNNFKEKTSYYSLEESLQVGFLSESHHKSSLSIGNKSLLSIQGDFPPLVEHFLHRPVEWEDPRLAIVIGQSWSSS